MREVDILFTSPEEPETSTVSGFFCLLARCAHNRSCLHDEGLLNQPIEFLIGRDIERNEVSLVQI